MEEFENVLEHPKKRRRRMESRKPVSARVVFDSNLRGDAAILSSDLWLELVSSERRKQGQGGTEDEPDSSTHESFIALSPWAPLWTPLDEGTWTIFPAKPRSSTQPEETTPPHLTITLSPDSSSCQSFLKSFDPFDQGRHTTHVPKSIDVRAVEVLPIHLDTVYVTIEKGLLENVDDIQNKFGGGFYVGKYSKSEKNSKWLNPSTKGQFLSPKERMTALVRAGLKELSIVHSGEVFPLPLPSHPITHVRPSPAIVVGCEPVTQGRVSSKTKIILVQVGSSQEKALKRLRSVRPVIEEVIEDTAEDTSNDQFYSAAEDRPNEDTSDPDGVSSGGDSGNGDSSHEHTDDASDDSMDDLISLSAPGLPPQQSGTLSAMTTATPRPGGRKVTGIHTPGSIYSSFTSATARAGTRPAKVFRTEALLRKVPREVLHPRPANDADEEAFIFVDTSTLAKIGCFSGDWVRLETAKNVSAHGFPSFNLSGLDGCTEDDHDWRTVRVFGLSGLPNQRLRYIVDKSGERRASLSQNQTLSLTPTIYLPPMLLNNLSYPPYVKVGVLPKPSRADAQRSITSQQRPNNSDGPPLAKEVVLLKVSTPLATSRDLQPTLFSGLKRHFECKRRVLRRGDLVAIAVDEELGKTTFSPANSLENGSPDDELAVQLAESSDSRRHGTVLAWFCVDRVVTGPPQTPGDVDDRDVWGGVATIDASITRMSQAGNSLRSVPESTAANMKYWLGLKRALKPGISMSNPVITTSDIPIPEAMPVERRLRDLICAATSPRAINLGLPPLVILLYSTQRQIGKTYTALSACSRAGVHTFTVSGHDLLSEHASTSGGGDVKTEGLLKARAERVLSCGSQYTTLLLQHIEVLTADRMVTTLQEIIATSRILIATTTELDKIPPGIRSLFTHELEFTAPNEGAREVILRNACLGSSLPLSPSVSLKSVALQTAALVAGDLVDLINRVSLARSKRLLSLAASQSVSLSDVFISGGQFTTHLLTSDFNTAISLARSTFSDAIGAPKIPTVTWADVGGLADQKSSIMETISLPLTHPELFAKGIRKRSGILFYGPPGTGKTLLAKAIATEFSLNFFSVKGPELLNMYIGESEANVRRVFQRARDARPCVVFFDELDSVAPKRGNQGDSGGVMDRIVSQLLAELDGMSSGGSSSEDGDGTGANGNAGGVFVIGATNRPDLLDPALLRPGRFDKMLYLGVASTHEQQTTILEALTRKFQLAPDVNLSRIAGKLPFTYTGADLYALCSDAMLKAITRKTRMVDGKVQEINRLRGAGEEISTGYFFDHLATPEDLEVVVREEDFDAAQRELVGSVSQKELEHFERIRNQFEEQDIGSGGANSKGRWKGKGKEKERQALPRPSPSVIATGAGRDSTTTILPFRTPQGLPPSSKPKGKSKAESFETTTLPGKGKERAGGWGIANPDSGPDGGGDEEDGIGVGADDEQRNEAGPGMNGSLIHNHHSSFKAATSKMKGKAAAKPRMMGGQFMDDIDGDDEGLYS